MCIYASRPQCTLAHSEVKMSSEIQRPNHAGEEGLYCLRLARHRLVSFSSARRCAREVFVEEGEGGASQLPARLYRYPPPHLTRMYPPPHF